MEKISVDDDVIISSVEEQNHNHILNMCRMTVIVCLTVLSKFSLEAVWLRNLSSQLFQF
jgi:hypothetical protein